ncbi:ligand-dependent nuclear receptor-interacting factor 1 [Candoia aspera]|uniref:ligand-dependent nuclear receptor-interacting factor 1 n=1 Tax=Candoia aspera TaxID=51853 RepID=UPI002FD80573
MSEMELGAVQNGDGEEGPAAATPSYITGRIHQAVTGLDGKIFLKLLPASKPLDNLKPLGQFPVMSHAVKGNVSVSHDNVKTLFTSTTSSPAAKISALKTVMSQPLILPKPLNQLEKVNVASVVKENPTTSTVSGIQSSYSTDRSSLQKVDAPVCSDMSYTDMTIVKTKHTPLSGKSPTLLSGHHLQIPPHAKVKYFPASFLPPVIQQKILAAATASNTSGTGEVKNAPTVIYVSPVNAVKMPASQSLQNICPKPVAEVSNSLILATPQKAVNRSAVEVSTSDSMKNQTSPMKWVVHENPQSSASCLVPVKSSNYMASKILKTLADIKNVKSNSTSLLPTCSNNESHAKITSMKDNALVMYSGKVYLLTRKEGNILSTPKHSKQESTNIRNQTSELISSATDSTIANQVVNLVLSKNKGIASNVKEPKSSDNMLPYLESEVRKVLKAESTPASPHDNLQISSTSQHEAVSSWQTVSVGINVAQKCVTKENTDSITQKALSSKATADATLPVVVHHAVKEEEQQVEITSSEMPIQMKHKQKQQNKQYLQLRKKFGLFKEERVYLRRIFLPVPSKSSEASVFSSSVQINYISNLMPMPMKSESGKEERIIGKQGEELSIKRKTKVIPVLENPKRRKNDVTTVLNSKLECNDSYSVMENLSNSCTQDLAEQEQSSSFQLCSHKVTNPCDHNNEENSVLNPTSYCHETALNEGSFKKDHFSFSHPDLEEAIKDEKITRLKLLLREQEAALEVIRKKMHKS